MTPRLRARTGLVLAALVPALVLSGCGAKPAQPKASASPTVSLPTNDVSVPAGVEITAPGTHLHFGQPATVAYEPNTSRNTALRMTVRKVVRGRISDLAAYVLDARTRASTPYYVTVSVTNVGAGDVGRTGIPVWAVDRSNLLIQASTFSTSFPRCPSQPLPRSFGPKAQLTTCLLYLVPNHGTLTQLSYRPLQAYEPITWTGPVKAPRPRHGAGTHKHMNKQKKKS